MNRHHWILTLGLAGALALAACGGGGGQADPQPDAGADLPQSGDTGGDMGDAGPGAFTCAAEVTVQLGDEGNALTIEQSGDDLEGTALNIGPGVAPEGTEVTVRCLDEDILPQGMIALSAPIEITGPGGVRPESFWLRLPMDSARWPEGADESELRVFVRFPDGSVRAPAFVDLQEDMEAAQVSLDSRVFGVYQVGVAQDAGQPRMRDYTFRAITGVSMGSGGASLIGLNNPEVFDVVGALGGPADWRYLAHYIREGGMGGFCPGADPDDPSTWECEAFSPDQEFEHAMTFDDWYFSTGEGTGGSFDRAEYVKIFQDLSYAFGNMGNYNPENPYLPAGVPLSELSRPAQEVCPSGGVVFEQGYYDDEYNPDGALPVIAFCDGDRNQDTTLPFDRYCDDNGDGVPDQANQGWYTQGQAQRVPMQIALAVDYNRNGVRDRGEPVIRNFWEPFEDVGADGLADVDEPGYDPVDNPDPGGDNYHWAYNPGGDEGNWFYDQGEPFEDVGLDGVPGTPQVDQGGYDWGQGNGQHDLNPNLASLLAQNPADALANLPQEQRQRALENITVYGDGGIRDLFNFDVTTNHLMGALQRMGANTRVYDDFTELAQAPSYEEIDVTALDYASLGQHVHVRYGDPQADAQTICEGDGKHVGEVFQTINRLLIMLGFVLNRTPDGDKTTLAPPYALPSGTYWLPTDAVGQGGRFKYSISMPPGYEYTQCSDGVDNDGDGLADGDDPDCVHGDHTNEAGPEPLSLCADGVDNDIDGVVDGEDGQCEGEGDNSESEFFEAARFPVVYLLHGYGQSPEDLRASLLFLSGYMAGGFWPKAILVFPDGSCGEAEFDQCNDGVDNDGDGLVDREDEQCQGSRVGGRSESGDPVTACGDGVDNDGDGLTDLADGGCNGPEDDDEASCVQGTFYSDHAVSPNGSAPGPQYEQAILDLVEHIDASYRTRAPETLPAIP
jgi:hypothetical protein